jgi:hypothetical protein
MEIKTKEEMYALLRSGKLGNTLRLFATLQEAVNAGMETIAIRSLVPNKGFIYSVSIAAAKEASALFRTQYGLAPSQAIFIENDLGGGDRLFSGELWHDCLEWSTANKTTREIMAAGWNHAEGLKTAILLRQYMSPEQRDWLEHLQHIYPGAIIEFTVYSGKVGWLYDELVIWEVRNY